MRSSSFSRRRGLCIARIAAALACWFASLDGSATPVISEFMAQNTSGLTDEDGTFSDWIEIHNPDSTPIDLGGWHLTDRVDEPAMWTFPETILPAGGLPNLLRFAFGLGVSGNPQSTQPEVSDIAGEGVRFRFRYNPELRGLQWRVEASADPGDWSLAEILFDSSTSLETPDANGMLEVLDESGMDRRFYRLSVTETATGG